MMHPIVAESKSGTNAMSIVAAETTKLAKPPPMHHESTPLPAARDPANS